MTSSTAPSPDVRAAIETLLAEEDAAWVRGDAEGFAARAQPDVSFTNVVGMYSVGREPFVAQHARIFSTIYKGSVVRQTVERIAMLRPDIAVVDTLAEVTGFQHAPPGIAPIDGAIRARLQQVLVLEADGWRVAAFHNVAVNPSAA